MNAERTEPTRWDAFALDAVSLVASAAFGQLFVAWPFLAQQHMQAKPAQVGLIAALYQGPYVLAVLAGRPLLDRIDPRIQAALSNLLLAVSACGMVFAASLNQLLVLVTISGLATSWLWPPVMGRVSAGLEAAALNRRLGRFNAAWSTGMVLGPLVGGYLYAWNVSAPFWSAMVYHIVSAALLMTCRPAGKLSSSESRLSPPPQEGETAQVACFRRMARVALVSGYVSLGLLRFQLPVLAEQELKMNSARFGKIGMLLSLTMALGFWALGRHPWWHFRARGLWVFQAVLACSLLLAYAASGAFALFLCAGITGVGISFLYASHLYYGVTGGARRSRRMAIHEVLVSAGFLVGAYGGGLLAGVIGLRAPYLIGCGALLCGVAAEMAIYRCDTLRGGGGAEGSPMIAP
ncbi:MAG: MFS transporter [Phycisphaerales bacterium]|nr:MFS transporter [Phycisphaerales bacterium]